MIGIGLTTMEKQALTLRGAQLLAAVRAHGDWIGRADLARATGKNQLSPHDRLLLDRMHAAGLIEVRETEMGRTKRVMYEYRARLAPSTEIP